MASFARLVVLLLAAAMGFSPLGVRELSRARVEQAAELASRPDGESVVMNRSEKQRGLHRQRIATPGIDPVSGAADDELAWLEPITTDRTAPACAQAIAPADLEWSPQRRSAGAASCRGPPVRV